MSLPKHYDNRSSVPEDLFIIPLESPKEINTGFLEEQNQRIESLIFVMLTIAQENSGVDLDTRDFRMILSELITMTTQVKRMFEHCRNDAGGMA